MNHKMSGNRQIYNVRPTWGVSRGLVCWSLVNPRRACAARPFLSAGYVAAYDMSDTNALTASFDVRA